MNLFKAELSFYLRSPVIWIIMALVALFSAWSMLMSVEVYTGVQVKFANMADAPSITQGVFYPIISSQVLVMVFVVAIVGGLSFSRLSQNNAWVLLIGSQKSDWINVLHKYSALITVVLLFLLPGLLAIYTLLLMTEVPLIPIIIALLGLLLLMMWMLALSLFISSLVNNTGFAILLNLLILSVLFYFSQSVLGDQWGKSWLQSLSGFSHFSLFLSPTIGLSSLLYFIFGTLVFLMAATARISHKRYQLS